MVIRSRIALSLLFFTSAIASAAEATGNRSFHLISFKCEVEEASKGPETQPQSPPLDVDDPATPGCNRWEINVLADGDLSKSANSWDLPLLDINYGVGDNIQLKYEIPYVAQQAGGSSVTAPGESRIGVKYMFFDNDAAHLELGFYPQVTLVGSQSDAVKRGLASPGSLVTLPLLLAIRLGETPRGEINLTANLGYTLSSKADVSNYFSGAVGVGVPVLSRLSVMGEISTEQAFSSDVEGVRPSLIKANAGVIGSIGRSWMLFGSVGHSLYSTDADGHSYVLAGVRLLTGAAAGAGTHE